MLDCVAANSAQAAAAVMGMCGPDPSSPITWQQDLMFLYYQAHQKRLLQYMLSILRSSAVKSERAEGA